MSELLPCVELEPSAPAGAAGQASVIWLHGLGASGHDFEPVAPMLGLPHARFVFPHAPERPVTINGGFVMPSWYDIRSLDHRDPQRESASDIETSARQVCALIERELTRGVSCERIVLAGFSQGGAIAYHVGARYPVAFAGLMALSTYLVVPERLAGEANPANHLTPLLACHGTRDELVPCERGEAAYQAVCALAPGRLAAWRTYPMGHEVCVEEIHHIGAWLQERLPA